MNFDRIRRFTSRALLGLAYIFCTLQWLWLVLIALPPLIENGAFNWVMLSSEQSKPITVEHSEPSTLTWIFVVVVTILILALTVVTLIRLPGAITKTGDKVVQKTTNVVLPVVSHHAQLPKKKRLVLSRRISRLIQLALVLMPLVLTLILPPTKEMSVQIVLVVAAGLAVVSLLFFGASWLLMPVSTSRTRSHASRG